ncbi:porin family protein [Fodinibius sp. Rm-B-1B1-1]|uniref:porin family protein n=1 Tax=Fodinibius alkaliphilus TaxID=3140241 RepID=UPI00315B2DDB
MISSIKKESIWLFIFMLISLVSWGQNHQGYDFRRVSVTVNGGTSLGDTNRNEYFLSSNFTTNIKDTPTFGLGVQYALTPIWSLELGYQRTQIRGLDRPFETNLNQIAFRNIINLNQLLMINQITERFNPFLTAGLGYDLYNYRSSEDEISNHNSSYNLGGGLAYKLTNTVDLFTHYDYHIGSNELDNETEGWGSDLINSLTAGIRLNFGKAKAIHPSWKPVPADLSQSDYKLFMAQVDRIDKLNAQLDQLEGRSDQNDQQHDSTIQNNRTDIDSLMVRMNNLEQQIDDLKLALGNLKGSLNPVSVNSETGKAQLLPAGNYVQIFASYNLSPAQRVRNHAVDRLNNSLSNATEKIFIIKRKNYYEVLIGVFNQFDDASNIQQIMTDFHEDAYVISFPRPVNLNIDFEGLKVVDEN